MDENLEEIPGIEYNFSQPIRDNVDENICGQLGQIAVKIYGDDLDELQRARRDDARRDRARSPGVADLGIVQVRRSSRRSRSRPIATRSRATTSISATCRTTSRPRWRATSRRELWEGEKRFDVTVRLPARVARRTSTRSASCACRSRTARWSRCRALADVALGTGRAAITRENGKRYVGIRMNVRNRDLGSFVAEAQQQVDAQRQAAGRLRVTVGRRVREPAARDEAARRS